MMNLSFESKRSFSVAITLFLATCALFWPITSHPFIIFDDPQYILDNPGVNTGLSRSNFFWAFGMHAANWHPLTWLSHQLDCTLFGLNAGRHHLINLLLHALNSVLIFYFLRLTTGALWRSALVAAFFAWHPLHVESVAWAAERKDTLCALFWMFALITYVRYVNAIQLKNPRPFFFYALTVLFFAASLMSKPMAVTLPCALLLLDFWPLDRFEKSTAFWRSLKPLVVEKIPFFLLSAASSVLTCRAQTEAMSALSFPDRCANALVAYTGYVAKFFVPQDLAIVYSHSQTSRIFALCSAVILLIWTIPLLWNACKVPFLTVGWLWFLGTLVPTIGLVQVGAQSMADRYTYIPSIGFFAAVIWGINSLLQRHRLGPLIGIVLAVGTIFGCAVLTAKQISLWRDSITLFQHAFKVSPNNYVAATSLGKAFEMKGEDAQALLFYRAAVEIEPRYWPSQFHLAVMLLERGDEAEGWDHLQAAAASNPQSAEIQCNIGIYHLRHNRWKEASAAFQEALRLEPGQPFAKNALEGVRREHPETR